MSYFIDICFICLKHSNNLTLIKTQDTNETSFEDKLQYFLPEIIPKSNIPKYICAKCGHNLSRIHEFKQKCLKNITTYEKYAQQITTTGGSYKYLSVNLCPDFVCQHGNIIESQTEINIDKVKSEEFTIKEEMNEELVSDDEPKSLLLEIKQENFDSNEICIKNEDVIVENAQISTENKNDDNCQNNNGDLKQVELKNNKKNKREIYNKSFKFTHNLRNRLNHTNSKHTCNICKKSFLLLYHLKYHLLKHSVEKSFTCKVCKKTFKFSQDLKRHRLIHANKKSYACKICKKSFQLLHQLERHHLTHTGEKPYTCEVCKRPFNDISSLNGHRSSHSTEKPFCCEVCNKSFRQLRNFKEHRRLHTDKSFTCEFCNKSFIFKILLEQHLIVHKFKCDECAESFSQKTAFIKHIYEVHRKNNELTKKNDQKLRVHKGAVPYFCKHCFKSFGQLIHLCSPKEANESQEKKQSEIITIEV